jgi:cell division protein FtsN
MNPPVAVLSDSGVTPQTQGSVTPQPPFGAGVSAAPNPAFAMAPSPEPFSAGGPGVDPINNLLNSIEANYGQTVENDSNVRPVAPATQATTESAKISIWVVQIASYDRHVDAQAYATRLKTAGFDANVSAADVGGKTRYRVEIGPLATRNEALAVQKNLRSAQHIENTLVLSRLENR